jgi:catecholate siderophore receptor
MDFRNNRTATDLDSSDDLWSPRAGLIYKPIEPLSIYASYSMTYVPRAGAQLASLNPTNEALDPEEFENIELGAKWDLNENLALTAAVFQLERTNVVIPDPGDPTLSILVKGQTNKGVELGVTGRVSDAWSYPGRLRLPGWRTHGCSRRLRLASSRSTWSRCGTSMNSTRSGAPGWGSFTRPRCSRPPTMP